MVNARARARDAHAREVYRAMHRNVEPTARVVPAPRTPRVLLDVRRVTRIWGEQLMGDGRGLVEFDHEFAPGAGPVLARDLGKQRNNGVLVGGHYRITDEGMIEDDMAHTKKHHAHVVRYSNPESWLMFFLQVGFVGFLTTIVVDMISGQLPARWNHKMIVVGRDVALLLGGIWLAKRSPIVSGGLITFVAVDAATLFYDGLDLDSRLRRLFRRADGATQSQNLNIPRSHGLNDERERQQLNAPQTRKQPWNSPLKQNAAA